MTQASPSPDFHHVLRVLDLATAPEATFQAELTAVARRVAAEQGLDVEAQRLQAAAQVVQLQATLTPIAQGTDEPLTWPERPATERERHAFLTRFSTGWRGVWRRLFCTDQGKDTVVYQGWQMGMVALAVLNLIYLVRSFHEQGWNPLWSTFAVAALARVSVGLINLTSKFQDYQAVRVDAAWWQRLEADPITRAYVQSWQTEGQPPLLKGDVKVITQHWVRQAQALPVEVTHG